MTIQVESGDKVFELELESTFGRLQLTGAVDEEGEELDDQSLLEDLEDLVNDEYLIREFDGIATALKREYQ